MTLPDPTVTVYLDLPVDGGDFFTLDHADRGELDNTTYLLAGDLGTDVSADGYDIVIRRGRDSEQDAVSPGTAWIALRNHHRDYDALNTTGPYYGFLRPGRPITVDIYGTRIYTGYIDDLALDYQLSGAASASVPCIDGLGLLARQDFDLWTTTDGQTAGQRITDVLNRSEVAWAGGRAIGTGISTLQDDSVSWGSNVLNYLQLVALSDRGIVFIDRAGVLTFRDRHALVNPTPVLTIADDGSGVPFAGADVSSAGERFYNRVGVDREGGTLQTVTDPSHSEQDGTRSLAIRGLLLDSDGQSLQRAEFELTVYQDPEPRPRRVTINVSSLSAVDQVAVVGLDLWDVVHLTWTPRSTGSEFDADLVVEGIEHSIPYTGPHLMTLTLSPVTQSFAFTLDDDMLGLLDGTGRLAF